MQVLVVPHPFTQLPPLQLLVTGSVELVEDAESAWLNPPTSSASSKFSGSKNCWGTVFEDELGSMIGNFE